MKSKYLLELGSAIITILGVIHLFYTFFTDRFSSTNEKLIVEMKVSCPILTNETTIWKAWIGFNASHSIGAIFIGIINFYLAVKYFSIFQTDHFFLLFNILIIGFYVWLAKRYWFSIPFIGLLVTLFCFLLSFLLILL